MIRYEDLKAANTFLFTAFRESFEKVLDSGWFILGNHVKKFEEKFSAYHQMPHCIGVGNGLDALVLSLKALSIPEGSEVIVPSNTYIATILAIIHAGLKPVLVEPNLSTYNIDPSRIEEAITPFTKAVLIVHLYGKCCEMDVIVNICKHHHLHLVEDCAQSHGAKYKQQLCGTFGDCAAFSFYPTKNLGALGDGGAVLCKNDDTRSRIQALRNYGSLKKYHNIEIGYNSRLDEMQAAFLLVKLNVFDKITEHKRKLASLYQKNLKDDFIKPITDTDYFDVFHIYAVRHYQRDMLKTYLLQNEIETEIHYPVPPHHQPALKKYFSNKIFPLSETIHQTILSLPCSFAHSEEDVLKVIEVINKY
jgi:dTDP-4-amino-4,6-dideoxygalactose transaminase